jgi:hypothetical protein
MFLLIGSPTWAQVDVVANAPAISAMEIAQLICLGFMVASHSMCRGCRPMRERGGLQQQKARLRIFAGITDRAVSTSVAAVGASI